MVMWRLMLNTIPNSLENSSVGTAHGPKSTAIASFSLRNQHEHNTTAKRERERERERERGALANLPRCIYMIRSMRLEAVTMKLPKRKSVDVRSALTRPGTGTGG